MGAPHFGKNRCAWGWEKVTAVHAGGSEVTDLDPSAFIFCAPLQKFRGRLAREAFTLALSTGEEILGI